MEVKVTLGIDKLVEVTADGVGAIAGPMLAKWKAIKKGQAEIESAKAQEEVTLIRTRARLKAQKLLLENSPAEHEKTTFSNSNFMERINYQEEKRIANVKSVVNKTAYLLGNQEVPDIEADHDWTARFFCEVQDVSSEDMQILWAKLLAGEIKQPKSISIRTLIKMRELDSGTALLFNRFCSMCLVYYSRGLHGNDTIIHGSMSSLGKSASNNELESFGFNYQTLNLMAEFGLILPNYQTFFCTHILQLHFLFQGQLYEFDPKSMETLKKGFKIEGPSLSQYGKELFQVVKFQKTPEYLEQLRDYYIQKNFNMVEIR